MPKQSESATKIVASLPFKVTRVIPDVDSRKAAAAPGGRTTSVDVQVTQAYRTVLASVFPRGMALVAVGGYGRRELFPYSDIDLLLLVDKDIHSEEQRQALSAFLRTLWDGSLRLSQSVRTVGECVRLDESNIELSISLLDARFLIGDSVLFEQLTERLAKYFRTQKVALLQRLCTLAQARHEKLHNTIYHLEPNIKEGPGGLRDLHTVRWIAKLREAPPEQDPESESARDFLWALRWDLHTRFGRDYNVLTFDVQEDLAADPAIWMREYFRHARAVYRNVLHAVEACEQMVTTGLMRSFRDWRSRLSNAEFSVVRDRVMLRVRQSPAADPMVLFRLFEFIARHGIRLSLDAERRIYEGISKSEISFTAQPPVWPALRGVLSLPHADIALRSMHETGLLHLILPPWRSIDCLVVRDFYHRYTVDEHTLVALGHIGQLRTNNEPSRRRFAEMLSEVPNVSILLMALLFHDIGKSSGLVGHAHASAVEAEEALSAIGMPEQERSLVTFLVEHHLDLSNVMNSRDLSDTATAAELSGRVETLEKLRSLTLLTYADISAVNPEAMTPWRLEQLWLTYLAGHRELTRELDTERIHSETADRRSEWLDGFPVRYVRTHTPQEIEAHIHLARESREAGAGIAVEGRSGAWNLTVVTADRAGLLAGLAGAVSSFGMNIVRAEAFANTSGLVLDSIVFEDPKRTLELNPGEIERMKALLRRVTLGREDVERLLRGRPRPAAPGRMSRILPAVFFDNQASGHATLVEIVAQDRPGLLYELAHTFSASGCSIDVVLVDTEAHKAIDVFYVTARGEKLDTELQGRLQAKLLDVCNA